MFYSITFLAEEINPKCCYEFRIIIKEYYKLAIFFLSFESESGIQQAIIIINTMGGQKNFFFFLEHVGFLCPRTDCSEVLY